MIYRRSDVLQLLLLTVEALIISLNVTRLDGGVHGHGASFFVIAHRYTVDPAALPR